jgi:lysophospholipase
MWYFLQGGYSVFAVDLRGHGRSVREVEDTSITHVDRFSDYLRDLGEFMEKIVFPRTKGQKLCLFGHSMGGAVAAFALIEHPEWFARAVLNAPMIAPVTAPLPRPLAHLMGIVLCALGKGKERAFVGKPFDPAREKFETSLITSRARFEYYQRKRCARKELQNCSPTYSWVREGAGVTEPLLKRAGLIRVPVMLCQAIQDTIVVLEDQETFIKRVPDGKLVKFDAKHELYSSHDEVLGDYVNKIIDFMSEE